MIVDIKESLLGDTILVEPAMTAYSIALDEPVFLHLGGNAKQYACLFGGNPRVIFADEYDKSIRFAHDKVVVPNASDAFTFAHLNNLPFAAGYFPQFGLTPDPIRDRLHYEAFGLPARRAVPYPYACLCNHARSCVNTSDPSQPPSIKAIPDWWTPIVGFLEGNFITPVDMGSRDDPCIEGAVPIHGEPFRSVMAWLQNAAVVISVETGLLHLAGGIEGVPIIFLSSATPPSFSAPRGARVVRAKTPAYTDFSREETINHIKEILCLESSGATTSRS